MKINVIRGKIFKEINDMISVEMLNIFLNPGYCDNVFKKNKPALETPEMDHILFQGHRVCYTKQGRGEPMVFFHNAGNDHRIWDAQVEYFSKQYEVYAVDSPGYGQSDRPDVDYTLSFYADMVEAFIDGVGIKNPVIAGHCVGSAMSLHYTMKNPEKVKALILFSPATLEGLRQGVYGIYYRMTRSRHFNKWVAKALSCFTLPRWKTTLEIGKQYGETGDFDPGFYDYLLSLYKHPKQLGALANLAMNFNSFAALDHFTNSDAFPPVFVLWGEQNKILPVQAGEDFCWSAGPDRKEIIENCGHLVMREKPEEVNGMIEAFIEENSFP